tara:strand:- start:133 stop:324 length:192 start_codon:yes stop_codon:yes gene_type:complete
MLLQLERLCCQFSASVQASSQPFFCALIRAFSKPFFKVPVACLKAFVDTLKNLIWALKYQISW